ncbi:MAG: small nuclear ribonucleoprotein [Candidatus Diapherotrites archaeon]|nr:small nuclear ribonucleoprotein [Candidatus Diapherotrites archaeon]MDN5366907.1 small nuclear ribonucleoprotein [Candidatus Diapherotrites archaeon]
MVSRPFDLLNDALGKEALIILKAGRSVRGVLLAFDVHMNLVVDDAELTEQDGTVKKLGRILIRGDTVVIVAPSP